MSKNSISNSVIRRLPRYYRFLGELENNGYIRISSRELSEKMGLTASQIRQDFNCFGEFGQQGYGYNVSDLRFEIGKILGLDVQTPMILLGAGNLGTAIASHLDFKNKGFDLIGAFDANAAPTKMDDVPNMFVISILMSPINMYILSSSSSIFNMPNAPNNRPIPINNVPIKPLPKSLRIKNSVAFDVGAA